MTEGSLRETLLDAAERLLLERSPSRLSLREVARRAGVSHAAPYNHFKDKAALLVALITRGHQKMDATMADAQAVAADSPFDQYLATGLGYLVFASRHPHLFRLMQSREYATQEDLEGADTHVAWRRLVSAVTELRKSRHMSVDEASVMSDCLLSWGAVHGLALLTIDAEVPSLVEQPHLARQILGRFEALFPEPQKSDVEQPKPASE